ncbi:MAG: tetratricopeptide repeat protein, partial [Polyangiaceae bacterium]
FRRALVVIFAGSLLAATASAQEVKRDPNGVTGISPYNEALAKGREAFTKNDHDGAIAAFDEAIAKDGSRVMAYLLKAQAQLDKGDLAGATATAESANGKKGTEEEQSKVIYLQAELGERKANEPKKKDAPAPPTEKDALEKALRSVWDRVKEGWSAYSAFVTEHTRAPNYSASADDRKQKVDDRVKREKDYGEVRGRADNK